MRNADKITKSFAKFMTNKKNNNKTKQNKTNSYIYEQIIQRKINKKQRGKSTTKTRRGSKTKPTNQQINMK
jgi:hypothetical protein